MIDSGRERLQAQLMLKDKSFMHPQETERWTKAFLKCACDPSIPGVSFKTGPRLQKRLRLIPGTPKNEVWQQACANAVQRTSVRASAFYWSVCTAL